MGSVEVEPDVPARIVINERTGTIIATANVRISTVAVSHGSLVITVASNVGVSQPNPLSRGVTAAFQSTQTDVVEKVGALRVVEDNPTIQQVAAALNALGLTTRDMMGIFQSMKRAGALQAELILN
jgi:flagellar P-ring protein precursor FlgI